MNDRDFADTLYNRARVVLEAALREMREPQSSDGKCAPHVAFDRVAKLNRVAAKLTSLANAAQAFER